MEPSSRAADKINVRDIFNVVNALHTFTFLAISLLLQRASKERASKERALTSIKLVQIQIDASCVLCLVCKMCSLLIVQVW